MRRSTALTALLAAAVLFTLPACSSSADSTAKSAAPASAAPASLDPVHITELDNGKEVTLEVGQLGLIEIDSPEGVDVFIASSADDVATVQQPEGTGEITANGSVTAVGPGVATITVQLIDDNTDASPATPLIFQVSVPGQG